MEKIVNFRPFAKGLKNKEGKEIKENSLFRSGLLYAASQSDIAKLKEYGIKTVLDLRSAGETSKTPRLNEEDFDTYNIDILQSNDPRVLLGEDTNTDFKSFDAVKLMDRLYSECLSNADKFGDALRFILDKKPETLLFHCTAGRDRTGVLSAILMMILDFDRDAIVTEYMRHDENTAHILAELIVKAMVADGNDASPEDKALRPFIYPYESNINAYLDEVIATHGTFDSYILETFGMNSAKKRELKGLYLEG